MFIICTVQPVLKLQTPKSFYTVHFCVFVWFLSIIKPTDALFIHFIENQGPLNVSSITCSSSGGATQTAFGILRAYNVSCSAVARLQWNSCLCHSQLTLYARNIPNAVCGAPPEDEQVMLETCIGPWFSINWTKSAPRWFHYTHILWCTVSKTLNFVWFSYTTALYHP
jgi:hypothetical protein